MMVVVFLARNISPKPSRIAQTHRTPPDSRNWINIEKTTEIEPVGQFDVQDWMEERESSEAVPGMEARKFRNGSGPEPSDFFPTTLSKRRWHRRPLCSRQICLRYDVFMSTRPTATY